MLAHFVYGAFVAQSAAGTSEREFAVEKVLAFVRDVERGCGPTLVTDAIRPIALIPDQPFHAKWTTRETDGSYWVRFPRVVGTYLGGSVSLRFDPAQELPRNLRLRTDEEAIEIARRLTALIMPEQYALGESWIVEDGRVVRVRTTYVLPQDRRIFVQGGTSLQIDRATGLPGWIGRGDDKRVAVAPERLTGILPPDVLAAEALRVQRALSPFDGVFSAKLIYGVPDFSRGLNEMTDAHRANAARREGIPMYELTIHRAAEGATRTIWVDARTGKGIAAFDLVLPPIGIAATSEATDLGKGLWRRGKASGRLAPVSGSAPGTVPVVLTNGARVATVLFDPRSGTCSFGGKTYRPDPALLSAMRREKPPKPFAGKALRGGSGVNR